MKIFLGGTCNESTWRDILIPMLRIDYYNPVVNDWNKSAQQQELYERENCNFLLYFITPKMTGTYAIAEAVDDSNKRPEKTIFGYLRRDEDKEFDEKQLRSLRAVARLIEKNGAYVCHSLEDIASFVNRL